MSLESEVTFSLKFLFHLNASKESTIFSPSSLLHLLSMIYAGSDGNTAKQIADVIGKDKNRQEIIKYYSQLINRHKSQELETTDEEAVPPKKRQKLDAKNEEEKSVKIYVSNKMFVQEGLKILTNYRKIIQKDFDSDLQEVNFADNVVVVQMINNYVKTATKEMIPQIVSSEDIDGQTKAALINAVYFKGFWEKPFEETWKTEFFSNPIRKIDVMTTSPEKCDWNFQERKDWKALGIPYKNRKAWIFIVLPKKKDGLAQLLEKADYNFFENVTKRRRSKKLAVTIPLMDITTTIDLPKYLNKLGITDAFDEQCNLTKMFKGGGNTTTIGTAIHKAAIKVDERGTEASAASLGAPRAVSSPTFFEATHPFMYFITSAENSQSITPQDILFIGTFC